LQEAPRQRLVPFGVEAQRALAHETLAELLDAGNHRVDARQSQKPIPRIYREIDVKSQLSLPLT
jgi:hypothetical protein